MSKLVFFLIILTLAISCSNSPKIDVLIIQQKDTSFDCNCTYEVEPFYNLDTLLDGGYHLKYYNTYSVMESGCYQIVDLMNGSKKVKTISGVDYRLKHFSLGWMEADYSRNFLFVTGVSGPNIFQVIDKATGEEILNGFLHVSIEEVILYSTFEDDFGIQKLRCFDGKSNNDFEIIDFQGYKCKWNEEYFGDCMQLDSISNSNILISQETTKGKVVNNYKR